MHYIVQTSGAVYVLSALILILSLSVGIILQVE